MFERQSHVALLSVVACAAGVAVSGSAAGAPGANQIEISAPILTISRENIEQTGLAIDVLREINKVRTDPQGYADGIRNSRPRIRGVGGAELNETLTFLDGQRPLSPLTFSPALTDIAILHIRDIGPRGLTSHTGSDGTTLGGRWRNRGIYTTTIAEELSFGQTTAVGVVLQFLVDPGQPTKPHRTDLFSATFTQVGAACGKHKQYGSACVVNLASPYMRDPPISSATPPPTGGWACGDGMSPWEVDAWRRIIFNGITNDANYDLDDILPDVARANETVYQANTAPGSLGLGIDAGSLWKTPGINYGFCAPTPAAADPPPTTAGLHLGYSFGPLLPDFFSSGAAARPGAQLDLDFNARWAGGQGMNFTADDLTDDWGQGNGADGFTADDLTCEPEDPDTWIRPRLIGGDYGTETAVTPTDVSDIYAGYSFSTSYGYTSIQAGINNLFNTPPPKIFNGFLANSDADNYDFLGRYFYVGLRCGL